jgi:hypothetical protein
LRHAAVDEEFNAGDIGAVVGSQEHRRFAEIVRCPDPAERDQSDCLPPPSS